MATCNITIAKADNQHPNYFQPGAGNPVMRGAGAVALTPLTTSASSQKMQLAAADWLCADPAYATIKCGGAIWVHVAAVPVAAVGTGFYLAADERMELAIEVGEKIAVIDG